MMDKKQQFIEETGLFFEHTGMTRMAGRIIGYLLICDPPLQTMPDLVEALQASKSSVSVSLRPLVGYKLVDQISLPGERRDYYRINNEMWIRSWRARMSLLTELRELADRGLDALANDSPETRRRLEVMREMNAFLEREFPKLLERWEDEKKARGLDEP
jgi:DNA-binding transcriptional regulator GbsR (MarR family)